MNYLSIKDYFNKLSLEQKHQYDAWCASLLPEGSLCVVNKPSSTKIYKVFKHKPPGSSIRYGKPNKFYEIQVACVLHLAICAPPIAKRGLTTFAPRILRPVDILSLGMIRARLDDVLKSRIQHG